MIHNLPLRTRLVHRSASGCLLASIALLGLAACSTAQDRREPQTNTSTTPAQTGYEIRTETQTGGFTIRHAEWTELGYRWDWTGFPAVQQREAVRFVDVYDDILIVQGSSSAMTIMESVTGRNRWVDRPATALTRFVGSVRDGNILYNCADAEVYIIDLSNGNWLGRQSFEEVVNTRPLFDRGTLIFGTSKGNIFAHRTDFGVRSWKYSVGAPIEADLAMVQGFIAAIGQNGQVLFVDPHTAGGFGRPGTGGRMATNPITDGSLLFAACTDQSLYAFTPGFDKHAWRYRTNEALMIQPTYHNGVVYLTVPGTGLVALDAATGSERWIGSDAGGEVIAMRAGSLIVWDGRSVKSVDPTNGDVISTCPAPGISLVKANRFDEGSLFALTRNNAIIRFSPR
ncbi:MAG: PQQ-binding-like beta-propeller repeat protein [Phycisphaeraceae bacterium]|nr:PQQ-binding-like beta-propeller repeat protein [Phycisphaeraceae bacterium]MCW5764028.1 PQQ-binding-like beta-propeller repeat protein [Phycisphaeraceae bacterium]